MSKLPEKVFESGFFVIRRMVPDIEPAPYKVPWGPRMTSTRSRSNTFKSGFADWIEIGASSRYVEVSERS